MRRVYSLLLCLLPFAGFAQSFTELSFTVGTGYFAGSQSSSTAYSGTLKRVMRLFEDGYISYGVGGTRYLGTQSIPNVPSDPPQQAAVLHAPIGAGYIVGKDKFVFTIGTDVMPSYYLMNIDKQFVVGFSPNFSLSRRIGKYTRLGIQGKVMFLPPSMNLLGFSPSFAGGGIVLQGW